MKRYWCLDVIEDPLCYCMMIIKVSRSLERRWLSKGKDATDSLKSAKGYDTDIQSIVVGQ